MSKIAVFVGTRPEIIKMASVIEDLKQRSPVEISLIHTGQHYDWRMSGQFFKELNLSEPEEFLGVGSGPPGEQLAKTVQSTEAYLQRQPTLIAAVEGDTNSALGVTLAASKNRIPVAHVEAGCRSFDKAMPEELNRILIADCADVNLAPTRNCIKNLQHEGIPEQRILLTGHPIVTLISKVKDRIEGSSILRRMSLEDRHYTLLTTHREENVDDRSQLKAILKGASMLSTTVVFPVHPRTKKNISKFHLKYLLSSMVTSPPLSYFDALRLIRDSEAVITDSGGIQQEAFLLKTPCLTIRKATEWVETVEAGVNTLVGDPKKIGEAFALLRKKYDTVTRRFSRAGQIFGSVESARLCARAIVSLSALQGR